MLVKNQEYKSAGTKWRAVFCILGTSSALRYKFLFGDGKWSAITPPGQPVTPSGKRHDQSQKRWTMERTYKLQRIDEEDKQKKTEEGG